MNGKKNLIALLFLLTTNLAYCQLKTKIRIYADPFNAIQSYSAEFKVGGFFQLEQFIDLNKSITFGVGATAVHLDHRDVYNHNLYPAFNTKTLDLIEENSRFTIGVGAITLPLEFNYYLRKKFSFFGGAHLNIPYRLLVLGWDNQPNIYEDLNEVYYQDNISINNIKPYVNVVFGANTIILRRIDIGVQFDWNTMNMFKDNDFTNTQTWGKETSEYFFVSLSLRFMLFRFKI